MTKKLMSVVALATILGTGALAFDAAQTTGQLIKETSATVALAGTYNAGNVLTSITPIAPGVRKGDVLLFPSFFSDNGWSTEFSVINTSSREAVVAKVVLYSAIDSRELKDFNIYLSANDVFRATVKDGNIVSTDGSTVVPGSDSMISTADLGVYDHKDSSRMASIAEEFTTDIDEPILEAAFELSYGFDTTRVEMFKKMRSNQPSTPSAGSCFKNPEGDYAGRLIEAVGLKGKRVGGMEFSSEHANFLVNHGDGTFEDAIFLIQEAQKKVFKEFSIWLECEVVVLDKRYMSDNSPLIHKK